MAVCNITNFAVCLPAKFLEYFLSLLNAPLQALLYLIRSLLTQTVNISLFYSFWIVIVYVISLFYGLFFLFAGFNFMISGYDAGKRENAKMWIANIVLMILFIQSSYFIYDLIIEINSLLTSSVIQMINPDFFLLNTRNFGSLGLQLLFMLPYAIIIVFTLIFLGLRYLLVSVGVVLFPIAIFFYFIPPLKSYGKMILNVLLITIFVTFFDGIILFGASILSINSVFGNYGILVPISAFFAINLVMIFLTIFAILKGAFSALDSGFGKNVVRAVKYIT
nr:hypothetical protein [Nanoarchaeum sp.]